MASVFNNILSTGVRSGQIPARTQSARDWFRSRARTERSNDRYPDNILSTSQSKVTTIDPGKMYHFFYDPKHKSKLPYYDRFPLIFMVGPAPDGFHGINLHYLPPQLRAQLMDQLYTVSSDKRYDQNTKVRISYNILSGTAKFKYFKPCFKHYLNEHVRSKFIEIAPAEWDIALFLPTERFEKANRQAVFADSRRMVK